MHHTAESGLFMLHVMAVPEAFSSLVTRNPTYSTSPDTLPFLLKLYFSPMLSYALKHDLFLQS